MLSVRFRPPAPKAFFVEPDEPIQPTVKAEFFRAFILKGRSLCGMMINIIKTKININDELLSKIKWSCQFNGIKNPVIRCGNLRVIKNTNLAYVEPHRVIIKEKLYLFFNEQNYFCIGNLGMQYPLSKLSEYIARF
jgi:hypothetical protein